MFYELMKWMSYESPTTIPQKHFSYKEIHVLIKSTNNVLLGLLARRPITWYIYIYNFMNRKPIVCQHFWWFVVLNWLALAPWLTTQNHSKLVLHNLILWNRIPYWTNKNHDLQEMTQKRKYSKIKLPLEAQNSQIIVGVHHKCWCFQFYDWGYRRGKEWKKITVKNIMLQTTAFSAWVVSWT